MVFGATPQVRKQTALLQQHLCLQWVSACAWLCIGKHALLNPFLFVTCLGCLACLWGQLETWSSYAKRQMNEESSFCMMNEWWEVVLWCVSQVPKNWNQSLILSIPNSKILLLSVAIAAQRRVTPTTAVGKKKIPPLVRASNTTTTLLDRAWWWQELLAR